MANRKLFFSYSRIDGSESAIKLATDLKKKGFDVWIDQEDIRAGLEWDTEIEKALESCDYVLFLGTEKSVVSNNVLDEVYYALEQHRKVIPLIFADCKMPFRLNRLQHIDFTRDYDTALVMLVNELEGNAPDITSTSDAKASEATPAKPFFAKNYRALVAIACVAVLIAAIMVFAGKGGSLTTMSGEMGHTNSDEAIGAKTESNPGRLNDIAEGEWSLTDVDPKAPSLRGYLKIEASGEDKASIKAYMQFYYPDSKAASSLSVFNAFVGCSSCALSKEMKLKVEDIAVSWSSIKKAREDQADGKKAGDTIADVRSTRSIYGTATLRFVDNNNAIIIVEQVHAMELTNDLRLEPFVYTFHFKKNE